MFEWKQYQQLLNFFTGWLNLKAIRLKFSSLEMYILMILVKLFSQFILSSEMYRLDFIYVTLKKHVIS